ncbi:hypothetical protein [Actinokineospora diospyrosa]|uniref:Uncharacterized protein n=1 Tax=Actinokineospora diospyrosa TaxID=103728 RepID=A0ABT1IHE9_9PSEU|nr:hypothetical protein [Actinokineospora diospyrosa]MCP2272052.1 hypothetical protein [Actinokineospora diospyrosa]
MVTRKHPHGLIGYVLEDATRTSQALRLLRWIVPAAVLVAIALLVVNPFAAAGVVTAATGLSALRRRRT